MAVFNRSCGVDVHEISLQEIKNLFSLARVDDCLAGFYVKEDGRVNPVDATMSRLPVTRELAQVLVKDPEPLLYHSGQEVMISRLPDPAAGSAAAG